jgi:hypothetical protein
MSKMDFLYLASNRKAKVPQCLMQHDMKTHGKVEATLRAFVTSATDAGGWSAPLKAFRARRTLSWMGLRAGLVSLSNMTAIEPRSSRQ